MRKTSVIIFRPGYHALATHRVRTAKLLILFHLADGRVRLHGVTACPNTVRHGWLKQELTTILAEAPDPLVTSAAGTAATDPRTPDRRSATPIHGPERSQAGRGRHLVRGS